MTKKKSVSVLTFGCKINQYESACILSSFEKRGYTIVQESKNADILIINTCCVTATTQAKNRRAIQKAINFKKESSKKKVVVTGCYSQIEKDNLQNFEKIDLVVDIKNKGIIVELLERQTIGNRDKEIFPEISTDSFYGKKRAFVKIQDGCNYFCKYCIVPFARGNPVSRAPTKIIEQVSKFADNGYDEVVLGGINIALYKYFSPNGVAVRFPQVLAQVEKVEKIKAIRISSCEPQVFTEEFFDFLKKSKKIVPHFHIPLQSGSPKILEKMGRRYSTEQFEKILKELKKCFSDCAIGTDVICGFPSEIEQDHNKTKAFLKDNPLDYFHVFQYSNRAKTAAAKLPNQVIAIVKKRRSREIRELSDIKKKRYISDLVANKTRLTGIVEKTKRGYNFGITDHYIKFYLKSPQNFGNKRLKLLPIKPIFDGVEAELRRKCTKT